MIPGRVPLVRALARKWDREGDPAQSGETSVRLQRIEQAIEAVAIEVERIAEAQRYTTRVLTERAGQPAERLPGRDALS